MAVPIDGETKRQQVAAMFSRISRKYDFMNTVMTAGMHSRWRRVAARAATEGLSPGPALDVATGTGGLAFELARRAEVQEVVGLDFVPGMLALAQVLERRQGQRQRLHWVLGDALFLPFPDSAFACVTSGFAMRNVTDVGSAVSEMSRVVRPGGRVALLEMTPLARRRLGSRLLWAYFSHVVPALGQVLAGDREAYTYLPESVEQFLTAEQLGRLMEEAGLVSVRWQLLGMGLVALHVGEKP
ncbi:MAG: ubiquinone/menaquinone biosynthesis methyltransferase [Dehalococcoidia bacterium]|nr:ubiquinone/menaquinone biosynthesis methyltransferase [Dehalococcoidia bacterium]